jgi:hypothetical protein
MMGLILTFTIRANAKKINTQFFLSNFRRLKNVFCFTVVLNYVFMISEVDFDVVESSGFLRFFNSL